MRIRIVVFCALSCMLFLSPHCVANHSDSESSDDSAYKLRVAAFHAKGLVDSGVGGDEALDQLGFQADGDFSLRSAAQPRGRERALTYCEDKSDDESADEENDVSAESYTGCMCSETVEAAAEAIRDIERDRQRRRKDGPGVRARQKAHPYASARQERLGKGKGGLKKMDIDAVGTASRPAPNGDRSLFSPTPPRKPGGFVFSFPPQSK